MKSHGEKLFTIEFSSSYDYDDYDEPPTPQKALKLSPKKPILLSKNTRQIKKEPPNLGGLIELSDSYYESNDSGENIKSKIKKINIKAEQSYSGDDEGEKDAFTLDDADQGDYHTTDKVKTKTTITQIKDNISPIDSQEELNQTNNDKNNHTEDIQLNQTALSNHDSEKVAQNQPLTDQFPTDQPPIIQSTINQSATIQSPIDQSETVNSPNSPSAKPSKNLESQTQQDSQEILYLITREKKTHLNGRRLFFHLYNGSELIYTAKCKTKSAHHVYIMKGNDAHLGSDADALILIGNDSSDFSLRKKKNLGSEVMTVRILPPKTTADTTRKMTVSFFTPFDGTPAKIFTKKPCLSPNGKIEHDFEGKFAIESIKNAVLVAKHNGPKMMSIRKTGEDSLEIEPKFEHEDLWIFAIGIASFLSRVKGVK